jgi:lactoylglutathione lyase
MITGIGHTAYDCYKFEATLDFYTRVLGFPQMFELLNDKGELWIVYLRVNDGAYIELFPKQGEPPAEKSRSYSHLCLEVDDIEATVSEVQSRGATIDVQIQRGKDGNRQAWTRDPEGNRIEFMEMAPDSLQRQAIARLKNQAP